MINIGEKQNKFSKITFWVLNRGHSMFLCTTSFCHRDFIATSILFLHFLRLCNVFNALFLGFFRTYHNIYSKGLDPGLLKDNKIQPIWFFIISFGLIHVHCLFWKNSVYRIRFLFFCYSLAYLLFHLHYIFLFISYVWRPNIAMSSTKMTSWVI